LCVVAAFAGVQTLVTPDSVVVPLMHPLRTHCHALPQLVVSWFNQETLINRVHRCCDLAVLLDMPQLCGSQVSVEFSAKWQSQLLVRQPIISFPCTLSIVADLACSLVFVIV
jgi:hypothetical protein